MPTTYNLICKDLEHELLKDLEHEHLKDLEHELLKDLEHELLKDLEHELLKDLEHELHKDLEHELLKDLEHELREERHAAVDPVHLRIVRGDLHVHHKVGGVPGGGQRACARHDLVARAVVDALRRGLAVLDRLQPHHRELREELLRL